jgi:hypothetical protein
VKDPLDEILAKRHVVEPSFLLQGQQGKAVHDLAREHAGTVSLRHAVFIVDPNAEKTRRGRVLLIRLDANDKTSGRLSWL